MGFCGNSMWCGREMGIRVDICVLQVADWNDEARIRGFTDLSLRWPRLMG